MKDTPIEKVSMHKLLTYYTILLFFFWNFGEANTLEKKNHRIGKNKILLMERSIQQRPILDQKKIQIKFKTIFGRYIPLIFFKMFILEGSGTHSSSQKLLGGVAFSFW